MEGAELQSPESSCLRNLFMPAGFHCVYALSDRMSRQERGFGTEQCRRDRQHALPKIRGSTRDLPVLRFVCKRTEGHCWRWSGTGLWTGLCWPAATLHLRLLRLLPVRVRALWLLRTGMVCKRRVRRRGALVSQTLLASGILLPATRLLSPRLVWTWLARRLGS